MQARFNAKYAVFSVIAIMTVYVLFHNERFLVEPENPVWRRYEPFKWWLLPHGIAGALTLLMAPLQFSGRLRRRFPRLHRLGGRLYVAGVVILAPLGAYIQYFQERLVGQCSFPFLGVRRVAVVVVVAI